MLAHSLFGLSIIAKELLGPGPPSSVCERRTTLPKEIAALNRCLYCPALLILSFRDGSGLVIPSEPFHRGFIRRTASS